ncbi:hypothetical protein ACX3YG_00290 [Pseudomonas wadenswilerensis]
MKEENFGKKKMSIKVPGSGGEFLVDGFAEAYEAFLEEKPSRRPKADSPGSLLMMVGAVVTFLGFSGVLFDLGSYEGARIAGAIGTLVWVVGAKLNIDAKGIPPRAVSPERICFGERRRTAGK